MPTRQTLRDVTGERDGENKDKLCERGQSIKYIEHPVHIGVI